jgi:hypothetical protein
MTLPMRASLLRDRYNHRPGCFDGMLPFLLFSMPESGRPTAWGAPSNPSSQADLMLAFRVPRPVDDPDLAA